MMFKAGDTIVGTASHNKDVVRVIVEIYEPQQGNFAGYLWKYPDLDTIFDSQGTDPLLEVGWKLVDPDLAKTAIHQASQPECDTYS